MLFFAWPSASAGFQAGPWVRYLRLSSLLYALVKRLYQKICRSENCVQSLSRRHNRESWTMIRYNTFDMWRMTPFLPCSAADLSSHWYNVPSHFQICLLTSSQMYILSYRRPLQTLKIICYHSEIHNCAMDKVCPTNLSKLHSQKTSFR